MRSKPGLFIFILLLTLLLAPLSPVQAASHALLIGVGEYIAPIYDLDGPPHDVAALKKLLIQTWGFNESRITTLVDGQATKANILRELNGLGSRTAPRDTIFIYFSCHGTSAFAPDEKVQDLELDEFTGALVPVDFKLGDNAKETKERLIIGRRDLKPVLKRLDRDRSVFAVVDACYSELALRSVFSSKYSWRYMDIPWYELKAGPFRTRSGSGVDEDVVDDDMITGQRIKLNTPEAQKNHYPYDNLVYISASSKREPAVDINRVLLKTGSRTIDGKPHGALTNALLMGLSGQADTNRDGTLTYRELYRFSRHQVLKEFPHTPQLQSNRTSTLPDKAVFGVKSPKQQPPPPPPTNDLRVKLDRLDNELKRQIAAISGIIQTDQGYEVEVTKEKGESRIYLANGLTLASFGRSDTDGLLRRIKRQVRIKELAALTIPGSSFNVFLEVTGRRGVLINEDPIGFRIKTEESAHIILINVSVTGEVSVIYPYYKEELVPVPAGQTLDLANQGEVSPPNGTEYLKVLAFRTRPDGFDGFMGAAFVPQDKQLDELMEMIRRAGSSAAQTTLTVITAEPGDMKSLL